MISSESKKGKKLHIEFLRFFCIWLVMFTHTSTAGFSLYLLRPESFFFPFYIAVPFWVKTAVPIFFMISGALLLKRKNRSLSSLRNEYGDLHKLFLSSPLLIIFIFTTDLIYHSLDTSLNFYVDVFVKYGHSVLFSLYLYWISPYAPTLENTRPPYDKSAFLILNCP